jgi:hypothetical protein
MDEKQDEETVAELFRACGLQPDRYPRKPRSKTPDFRVSTARGELFICEVKSVRSTANRAVSNDTLYGAITNDVEVAVQQFAAVNLTRLVPNVLVWITHNPRYNINTFVDLVRGKVVVQGQVHADLRKQRFGKFAGHFGCIDLFIWVHSWGAPEVVYNVGRGEHLNMLTRALHSLPLLVRQNDRDNKWVQTL